MRNDRKKIMIVDDNDGIVASLTMVLQYGGYDVVSMVDGEEVKNISVPFPDLILLDIFMAGVSGLDLCKHFKSRSDTKDIPIVMISAYPDSRDTALGAGADDFIGKPYTIDEMLTTVKKHLSACKLRTAVTA